MDQKALRELFYVNPPEDRDVSAYSFTGCEFPQQIIDGFIFDGTDIVSAQLRGTTFQNCSFKDCQFDGSSLVGTNFTECEFKGATFVLATADSCSFKLCDLRGVDLQSIEVNEETAFQRCNLHDATISRMQLSMMRNYGGIPAARRSKMNIVDDALRLRTMFSGHWSRIHLIAMMVFIFPYAFFIVRQWLRLKIWDALPVGDGEEITLFAALVYLHHQWGKNVLRT